MALVISVAETGMAGFWSATTSVYEPRYAWVLYPLDGVLGVGYKSQADFHTLAVRRHAQVLTRQGAKPA